jgi:hypothetical protein
MNFPLTSGQAANVGDAICPARGDSTASLNANTVFISGPVGRCMAFGAH